MQINQPISVISSFNHHLQRVEPRKIFWAGREYLVTKVGLHHTYRTGRTLYHVFSLIASSTYFKLSLNTDNLFWNLEEISNEI